jgi:endoglucanase Acf2
MSDLAASKSPDGSDDEDLDDILTTIATGGNHVPEVELLMFALPHHQERMKATLYSSNLVFHEIGCTPTIHGMACPAMGGSWSLVEHLHRTNFSASKPIRSEMKDVLVEAVKKDLKFVLPRNYMHGAGDTYFSGKMLARLARVVLIADELGFSSPGNPSQYFHFEQALDNLQQAVEVWFNGSAESPFLFDQTWRGIVMCGCDYTWNQVAKEGHCANQFNAEDPYHACPALVDMGHNFGAGFYNDHHYHFGYHIYAAAVLSKYRWSWAKQYAEHVLLLVRDIANPSEDDPFFPTWRHKDWYLGFSWASGVVTIAQKPYPNGRNQESVSEAIAAYEAVALFGDVLQQGYKQEVNNQRQILQQLQAQQKLLTASGNTDSYSASSVTSSSDIQFEITLIEKEINHALVKADSGVRIRDMGRLLMATEVRSAKTYWHVQEPGTPGVSRIYPREYEPKIVGMIWSMLAQEQTWFGNEEWKSYGIHVSIFILEPLYYT